MVLSSFIVALENYYCVKIYISSGVKNPPSVQKTGWSPGLGRFPRGGNVSPLRYSCPRKILQMTEEPWLGYCSRVWQSQDTTEATDS